MNAIVSALVLTAVVSLVIQAFLAWGFARCLRNRGSKAASSDPYHKATIVLCLRGGDPFLTRCIQGIVSQEYPNYQIMFVVDHANDPALPILREALTEVPSDRYQIEILDQPLTTCSLKCSSLLHALSRIDDDVHFVAFIDADTIAHPTWLRELAIALQPENVGAATGNRWYMPTTLGQGAVIRSAWNIAAVVQMYWYEIAWGGTLAVKMDSIRRAKLTDRWSQSFCEDTMLRKQLATIGQKVRFVPSLMMINREDCSVGSFSSWVQRQLLTARLYHPAWPAVLFHGVTSTLLTLACWLWLFWLTIQRDWLNASIMLALVSLFNLALTWLFIYLDRTVAEVVKSRGEQTNWRNSLSFWRLFSIVWLTQWIYAKDLLCCVGMRQVDWRGVTYSVDGPWKIRLHSYRPYQEGSIEPANALESL